MPDYAVVVLSAFCIALYTGQTFFNKLYSSTYEGPAGSACPVFSIIYGLIVSVVTFALNKGRFAPSAVTVLLGVFNGCILFLYNLGMIQAARRGPYTFQSIVMLFGSIVVCLVFSAGFWGDHITPMQLVGIAVMLLSFVALNAGGLKLAGVRKGYYFWVFLLFFSNGFYGVFMDSQQRVFPSERNEMIILTFASLSVLSLAYLGSRERGKIGSAFVMSRRALVFAVMSSLCAAFAVFILMILLKHVPSYILFTINNGGVLVLSAVLSFIILKEKPTKLTVLGVLLAVTSIVMLSI